MCMHCFVMDKYYYQSNFYLKAVFGMPSSGFLKETFFKATTSPLCRVIEYYRFKTQTHSEMNVNNKTKHKSSQSEEAWALSTGIEYKINSFR